MQRSVYPRILYSSLIYVFSSKSVCRAQIIFMREGMADVCTDNGLEKAKNAC